MDLEQAQPQEGVSPNVANKIASQEDSTTNESPFMESEPTIEDAIAAMEGESQGEDEKTQEAPKQEVKEEPKAETKEESLSSEKFVELARLESKHQAEMLEMKKKLEGFEGKKSKDELLAELKAEYKKNPREFLEKELEGSYDSLSDFILNEEERTAESKTMSVIDELKAQVNELKEERNQEKETQKTEAVKKQESEFKDSIKNFVSENEDFSLVKELDESGTVFDVMMEHFNETGKTMDINDACQKVEDYYVDSVKKIMHIEKVKNLFNLDNIPKKQNESEENENQSETITNDLGTQYSESEIDSMSDEERMRLALEMI
jgi:hypothetical protein